MMNTQNKIKDKLPLKGSTPINNHNQNKFIVPFYRTAIAISSLFSQWTKIWNNETPEEVKNAPSSKCFVKRYQKYLSSQANPHM